MDQGRLAQLDPGQKPEVTPGVAPNPGPPELRPYQVEGVLALLDKGPVTVIADPPRAGKTSQALLALKAAGVPGPWLVVCPAAGLVDWAAEVARWVSERRALILAGRAADRAQWADAPRRSRHLKGPALGAALTDPATVILCAYDRLVAHTRHGDDGGEDKVMGLPGWAGRLVEIQARGLLLDEGHWLRGRDNARVRAVRALSLKADRRIVITATPVYTYRRDLWGVLSAAGLPNLPTERKFDTFYCAGFWDSNEYGATWNNLGRSNSEALETWSQTWMVRRPRSVVDKYLPPREIKLREGSPEDAVDTFTESLLAGRKVLVLATRRKTVAEILKRFTRFSGRPEGRRINLLVAPLHGGIDPVTRAHWARRVREHRGAVVAIGTAKALEGSVSLRGVDEVHLIEVPGSGATAIQAINRSYEPGGNPQLVVLWSNEQTERAMSLLTRSLKHITDDTDAGGIRAALASRELEDAIDALGLPDEVSELDAESFEVGE